MAEPLERYEERPWGTFEILTYALGRWVKLLKINPKQRTSLQSHRGRDEVWTVMFGIAEVTLETPSGEMITTNLLEGQTVTVPRGAKHRIRNAAEISELVIVEVAIGDSHDYLDEEDIKRYEDDYGRHQPGVLDLPNFEIATESE